MKSLIQTTAETRAVLDGTKSQFRLPIKGTTANMRFVDLSNNVAMLVIDAEGLEVPKDVDGLWATFEDIDDATGFPMFKSKYQVGDVLYVREAWAHECCEYKKECPILGACESNCSDFYCYKADGGAACNAYTWHSPATMPREAARIFLIITAITAEKSDKGWEWVVEAERPLCTTVNADSNRHGHSMCQNCGDCYLERTEKP